jgi:hypothetical protein
MPCLWVSEGKANLVQDPLVSVVNGTFEESDHDLLKGFGFPQKLDEGVHLDGWKRSTRHQALAAFYTPPG